MVIKRLPKQVCGRPTYSANLVKIKVPHKLFLLSTFGAWRAGLLRVSRGIGCKKKDPGLETHTFLQIRSQIPHFKITHRHSKFKFYFISLLASHRLFVTPNTIGQRPAVPVYRFVHKTISIQTAKQTISSTRFNVEVKIKTGGICIHSLWNHHARVANT